MSLRPIIITLLVVGVSASFGILYYKKEQQRIEQQRILQDMRAKEKKEQHRKELQALFDIYLNDFKIEIQKKTRKYKESRKALKEITKPENFETPDYAKESYDVFKSAIKPSLQKQTEETINIFEKYRTKIKNDIENKDSDVSREFVSQWRHSNDEQLSKIIDFFAKETVLIQSYDDLITFYYTRSKLYTVDTKLKIFIFDRDEDIEEHARLLNALRVTPTSKNQ